jgi:hypothetical protein
MVHITNWETLTSTIVDGINVNSASIIHNPTVNDMLGLRCKPNKIYHVTASVDFKILNELWVQTIRIDSIIFPLAHSMQIGIAKSGKECQIVTPISHDNLTTPESFLKFVKQTVDNSIKLLNNV